MMEMTQEDDHIRSFIGEGKSHTLINNHKCIS